MKIETPARFKGKDAFYEKMLRMFVKDLPDTWVDFDAAIADMDKTKAIVHKIKGTAGNLDIQDIYQVAIQLETTLRNNQPDKNLYLSFICACSNLKNSLPPPT